MILTKQMKINDPKFSSFLRQKPLRREDDRLYFIDFQDRKLYEQELSSPINRLKTFLKKWPWFYNFLQTLITPAFTPIGGLTAKQAIKMAFAADSLRDNLIVNLGSGTKRLHREVINLDIYPFLNVEIVADVKTLPFKDSSMDMAIIDSVLEHIDDANAAIKEITRVVKVGGYVYVSVPFVYPFHASPNDFYRWSLSGLEKSFSLFKPLSIGMRGGPAGALQGVLMHFLALSFSFGIEKLYILWSQVFMALLSPLKLLDFFFRFLPQSHEIGSHIYFFGRKTK